MTFHAAPCAIMTLDVMDVSGETQLDVEHDIYKHRIRDGRFYEEQVGENLTIVKVPGATADGKPCGSCYGAEAKKGQCCNTCAEVQEAYRKKGWAFVNARTMKQCAEEGFQGHMDEQIGEGCNFHGSIRINKVGGNFHFAPGKSFQQGAMHVHDLLPLAKFPFNMSHTINKLSFGEDFPGAVNPLDGERKILVREEPLAPGTSENSSMYQYFLKVVPTKYTAYRKSELKTNQYSVTENEKSFENSAGLPGVFFFYDISPIKVSYTKSKLTFLNFLTSVCAIVGGVFTVSGIVDSFVYHGHKAIKKKMDLGKLS